VVDALEVELEIVILDLGVVPPENLKKLAVAGAALIRGDDTIGCVVSATRATHSDLYHFSFSLSSVIESGA
jgi:hypothetical protein